MGGVRRGRRGRKTGGEHEESDTKTKVGSF